MKKNEKHGPIYIDKNLILGPINQGLECIDNTTTKNKVSVGETTLAMPLKLQLGESKKSREIDNEVNVKAIYIRFESLRLAFF